MKTPSWFLRRRWFLVAVLSFLVALSPMVLVASSAYAQSPYDDYLAQLQAARQQLVAQYQSATTQQRAAVDAAVGQAIEQTYGPLYGSLSASNQAELDEETRRATGYTFLQLMQGVSTVSGLVKVIDILIAALPNFSGGGEVPTVPITPPPVTEPPATTPPPVTEPPATTPPSGTMSFEPPAQGGEVSFKEAGYDWKPLSPVGQAMSISDGSAVRTGQGSVVIRDFPEQGDQLFVGQNTEFQIAEQGTVLDALQGKLRVLKTKVASWAKKFEVRTGAAAGGVRGTDFVVDATPERTEVLVLEGTVEVSDLEGRRTVLVEAGEYSVVMAGELPTEPQGFEDTTVSQDYGTLFRSEAEMKAVLALLPPSSTRGLSSTTVKLRIANASMSVNGVQQPIDAQGTKPVIVAGRTLVPIRAIIEAFGGSVVWEASTRKVTITLGDSTLDLWIGKSQASLNGATLAIDSTNAKVVPEIINSRTMLPLRFVTENLGAAVGWDQSTQTITITYQQ